MSTNISEPEKRTETETISYKIPHKTLVCIFGRTHLINTEGEYTVPCKKDFGKILLEIKGNNEEECNQKFEELIKRCKEWLK